MSEYCRQAGQLVFKNTRILPGEPKGPELYIYMYDNNFYDLQARENH